MSDCELPIHSVERNRHFFRFLLHEERGVPFEVWISLHCGQMNSHTVNDQVHPGGQWQKFSSFELVAQLSDELCFMQSGLRGTAGQMLGIEE